MAEVRVPESTIKAQIWQFLQWKKVMCWVQASVGIYDQKAGRFRTLTGTGQRKGVSDILGIFPGNAGSIPLAIEVKAPGGALRVDQWNFLRDFHNAGGIAIVATSVEIVERCLFLDENAPHGNLAAFKEPKPKTSRALIAASRF